MTKKIISAILVVAMLLTLSVSLFSCKKDKEEAKDEGTSNVKPEDSSEENKSDKKKYTVTVVDQDGNPVADVEITLHFDSGIPMPFDTDENGQVAQNLSKAVKASVTGLPAGYSYSKLNAKQDFDADGNLKITVEKEAEKAPLKILVVDQDGKPIAGVSVQACDSEGSCRLPQTTNAEGAAFYPYETVELHAQLTGGNVPEGYSVADPTAYYNFVDGVATIVLNKN